MGARLADFLKLERKDFLTLLLLVVIDLSLTSAGIITGVGEELAPQFVWFTLKVGRMFAGIALYIIILVFLNVIVRGRLRNVLVSAASGMHFTGIISWLTKFLAPSLALSSLDTDVIYGYLVLVSLATAASYHLYEVKGWRY